MLSKKVLRTFSSEMQSAVRILCPPNADKGHACGLSSVFSEAHVPGENGFHFLRACGRERCEAFPQDERAPSPGSALFL